MTGPAREWRVEGEFGLDRLRLVEADCPRLGPLDVRVRVGAVALNYRDILMVAGAYDPRQPLPLVPCSDAAGRVEAIGEAVTRFAIGDLVCPIFAQRWLSGPPTRERVRSTLGGPLRGTLTEVIVLPEDGLVRAPAHLGPEGAATLPCAGVTAWNALTTCGELRPGETVLILGTGGVSTFALQLAHLLGAEPIVTSSSDEKLERARSLGARETINYVREPRWGRAVRKLTGGGVDLVVEVGGATTLAQSLDAVRIGGRLTLVGVVGGAEAPLSVTPLFMKLVTLRGILVGHRESFETLNAFLERHRTEPVVDRIFPFAEARDAFTHLASGRHQGKVVVGLP